MKKLVTFLFSFYIVLGAYGWGQTGHRVVGQIAWNHLSPKAKKNIEKVLGNTSLAMCATFMDEIKSDNSYDKLSPWHYCTIPDGQTYDEVGTPKEGDVIWAIRKFSEELKTKQFEMEDEAFVLKCLVHLVGDIHQPLHVGNGNDRGGNDVKLEYFWSPSNLHRVWDSGIIDKQGLSYTEYTKWIDHVDEATMEQWQNDDVLTWAKESTSYRNEIYALPEDMKISYQYNYKHLKSVNLRLQQAGIRLAGLLNEIYG